MGDRRATLSLRSRRAARSGGSSIVETALIFLPFLAVILGITDISLALYIRQTMQHAVREGVRYAITYQVTAPGDCQIPSIKRVVKLHSMGFLNDQQVADHVTVKFYAPDTGLESGENRPGQLVEVSIENYEWKWIAPLWRNANPLKVTVRSSDRMEGLGGAADPPCLGS